MEQNKIMEGLDNPTQVLGGVSNSKGGMVAKLAVGALGVAAGIGAVLFLKKRKAKKTEEIVELDTDNVDDNE